MLLCLKLSFCPRIVFFSGFFIFTWVTSAPEEERIGWILLTCCCPALLIRTLVGWGWQGITEQLLSDKLNWGNHKQNAQKRAAETHWPIALNQLSVLGPSGKQEENLELSLEVVKYRMSQKRNSKKFGAIQIWGWGGGEVLHILWQLTYWKFTIMETEI